MDVKGYSPLEGSQEDINRRLLHMIEELQTGGYDDTALKARVKACEDAIGTYTDEDTIADRLDALETPSSDSET